MTQIALPLARRVGAIAAAGYAAASLTYAVLLVVGLASLPSPDAAIGDPIFSLLEILILLMVPLVVAIFCAIHALAPADARAASLAAVIFAGLLAGVTAVVHFSILTLSRQPEFAELAIASRLFAFEWPSLAYALDILAWDVFFALAVLFAIPAIGPGPFARSIRWGLGISGALALAGLLGVVMGDMQVRNIGILGYVGTFTVTAVLLSLHFRGFKHQLRPGT